MSDLFNHVQNCNFITSYYVGLWESFIKVLSVLYLVLLV